MPTSPDKKWSDLLDLLADNNVGGISEEDVRAIARYARTSYSFLGASGVTIASWVGTINSTQAAADIPQYVKLRGLDSYAHGENYLSPSTLGILYAGGVAPDDVKASRIVQFSWNIEMFATSLESCAIAWYYLPTAGVWPTDAKRHRIGRMYTQSGWTALAPVNTASIEQTFRRTNPGYITASNGTGTILLNPGDTLVPILEHYGPSAGVAGPLLSFNLSAVTLGVVDAWTTIPSTYWNTVADVDVDTLVTGKPFTAPSPLRLYGNILT